jgi:hypothetical protein
MILSKAKIGQREEKMKTFKDALKTFFTTGKRQTPESFHDEKRYAEIMKDLDTELAKMRALVESSSNQASS